MLSCKTAETNRRSFFISVIRSKSGPLVIHGSKHLPASKSANLFGACQWQMPLFGSRRRQIVPECGVPPPAGLFDNLLLASLPCRFDTLARLESPQPYLWVSPRWHAGCIMRSGNNAGCQRA
jgi:hypothetical protein